MSSVHIGRRKRPFNTESMRSEVQPGACIRAAHEHGCVGGNGKDIFGDAWWLDTDGEAFQQRAAGSVAGSEGWQSRRPASVVSAGTPLSMASGFTALTDDHRCA